MGLTELSTAAELTTFLSTHSKGCLVTFSAHWCGPCRASKPQLEAMAMKEDGVPFGYVYESDIGDFLHTFQIRAFPTYVAFVNGSEVQRVEGVNFAGIQQMVANLRANSSNSSHLPETGGNALGGGGGSSAVSPEEARALRLARLGGAPTSASVAAPAPAAAPTTHQQEEESTPMDAEDTKPPAKDDDNKMDVEKGEEEDHNPKNPIDALDAEAVKTLTESMGFTLLRAQKGLLFSSERTVESAVEWLMEHQDDVDIDEPIPVGAGTAQSYRCNECGRILSNMANLELHANKTGHSDFEESTE